MRGFGRGKVSAEGLELREPAAVARAGTKRRPELLLWSAAFLLGALTNAWGRAPAPQEPDRRAAAAERQMTDQERIQLLHGVMPLPLPNLPPPPAGVKPTAGYVAGIPRLGIPDLLETDGSLGITNPLQLRAGEVATAMPAGLALAASFDPELAQRVGAAIGSEAQAKGFNVLLGVGVNLARDARNGRNFEYLGEDPLLAGLLGGAEVSGIQSQHVVATLKHFALNDQETLRQSLDARIDEAGLRESDLLAFELAIERGQPGAVMCAYNKLNGEFACGNDWLLNQVLKGDWQYKGWVMSDWGAVKDDTFLAKGLDQESGEQLDEKVWFGLPLEQGLHAGRIAHEDVSAAVRRILRSVYAVGADQPRQERPIDFEAHAQVARQVAREGMVLLKNDGILPLAAPQKVVLIGGHADIGVLSGGGSSQVTPYCGPPTLIPVGGWGVMAPFKIQLFMPSSPLSALKSALPRSEVQYDSGYDVEGAAAVAQHADVAIVFATQWQAEGSDLASMSLPEGQDKLIAAVAAANPHTIVVLETGNPVHMPWLAAVHGVIEAWYPGEQGAVAIAEVLTGSFNPSGRLPMTFPQDESELPRRTIPGLGLPEGREETVEYSEGALVGYRWFSAKQLKPLFPFGHGLSYTTFTHHDLRLEAKQGVSARFTVENSGTRAGSTVAQLYLVEAAGQSQRRLVGFRRVDLEPGASRQIELRLDPRLLAGWEGKCRCFSIAAGQYSFALGESADKLSAVSTVSLKAQVLSARVKPDEPP